VPLRNLRDGSLQSDEVYIGRGSVNGQSGWGNPFTHQKGHTAARYYVPSREEAISRYREWLKQCLRSGAIQVDDLAALHGKMLVCWCAPLACHGDVLIEAAKWAANRQSEGNHG
jgi:hypothetical protein